MVAYQFLVKKIAEFFLVYRNLCIFATAKQKRVVFIGLWCNGNTSDSGPDVPSSSLGSPTS